MIRTNYLGSFLCLTLCMGAWLSGCASKGQELAQTETKAEEKIEQTVQIVEPTSPVTSDTQTAEISPSSTPDVTAVPESQEENIKQGTFTSVVQKIGDNPLTLYWSGDQTYTFYIGGLMEAKYKPGDGLMIREDKEDTGVVCNFSDEGKLSPDASAQKQKCGDLMFALDQQLTD